MSHPAPCARCRSLKVLTGLDASGAGICGPVGGHDYACPACGRPGNAYRDGNCARCVLESRLNTLLADQHGNLAGQYATLAAVLLDADKPRSVLQWLNARRSSQLLRQLTADNAPLTHEVLDDLPPSLGLHYLRRLLIFAAVLPPRQDQLERITPWLREQLRDQPPHHGHLIRPYAEWDVLHRARRKATRHGGFTVGSANNARSRVSAAQDLLTWLDTRYLTLDRLTQPHLDLWLDQSHNKHKPVKYFLRWAARRGLTRDLTVPAQRRGTPPAILSDEQRWHQLRRCLHEQTMPLHVRVVGALSLLLGVTTSRILRLTVNDVTVSGTAVSLTLGRHPIELPPRVADLVLQQVDNTTAAGQANAPEVTPWLFPGSLRVEPMHPAHMCNLLARNDIDAGEGRHAALVDLAADLPASVLAPLLGIDITTALAWNARAQADWSTYVAARRTEANTLNDQHDDPLGVTRSASRPTPG